MAKTTPTSPTKSARPDKAPKKPAKAVKVDKRGTPKGKATIVGKGNGQGGRIGNPPFVATDAQRIHAQILRASGAEYPLIAEIMNISLSTLQKHFKHELETAKQALNARIGGGVIRQALNGNINASRLWLTTHGGWSVKTTSELVGAGGAPIDIAAGPRNENLKALDDEELRDFLKLKRKMEGVPDARND